MKILYIFLIFVFVGCATKVFEKKESKIVVIKTPSFRFSDIGYLKKTSDEVVLELFSGGVAVERFDIKNLICTSKGCVTKSGFNSDYLVSYYPSNLILNILLQKPIYDGINLKKTDTGFIQKIKTANVDIIYKVKNNQVFFKDRKNGIIIKLKDVDV